MARRFFNSTSPSTTLTGGITDSAGTMTLVTITGFPPTYPFVCVIDPGLTTQEVIEVISLVGGTTFNVTRGVDGTSNQAHTAGAIVQHAASGRDFDEANNHVNLTTGIHGLAPGDAVVKLTHSHDTTAGNGSNIPAGSVTGLTAHTHDGIVGAAVPFANVTGLATHDHTAVTGHGPNIPIASVTGLATHVHGGSDGAHVPVANVTGAAQTLGTTGMITGSVAGNLKVQGGSTVITTDGSGLATVTFPSAFPNGICVVVCCDGALDAPTAGLIALYNSPVPGLTSFKVKAYDNVGGVDNGSTRRVAWIALGY